MSLSIERIPNKRGRTTILLRESWREGKRIRKKTHMNLTDVHPDIVSGFDTVLRGGVALRLPIEAVNIRRSWRHGHVAAALGVARSVGLERILHGKPSRKRDLALASIVAQVTAPDSRLSTERRLSWETANSSLGLLLGLGSVTGEDMLSMLDWLLTRQRWIEKGLANRHLNDSKTLLLYEVTPRCLEGRSGPLADFGYDHAPSPDKKQIVVGLVCSAEGCPLALESSPGSAFGPATLQQLVENARNRFGIERIALVGNRRMTTTTRIRTDIEPAGLDWIAELKTGDIRRLLRPAKPKRPTPLNPESMSADVVTEITSPDFPGDRLIVCLDPRLKEQQALKREALLQAAEAILETIAGSVRRGLFRGREHISCRVRHAINRKKIRKCFTIKITDDAIAWSRRPKHIKAEQCLDGISIIRTSLDPDSLGTPEAIAAFKSLPKIEQSFLTAGSRLPPQSVQTGDTGSLRASFLLCLLAEYLEWHMRRALAPMLFDDGCAMTQTTRASPATLERVAEVANPSSASDQAPDELPAHCFETLMDDLSNLTLNRVTIPGDPATEVALLTEPTPVHARALKLLGVSPEQTLPGSLKG